MKPSIRLTLHAAALTLAASCAIAPVAFAPVALAQSDDPHAVLDKGAKASGLTGADVPAWHLKATYTLYDVQSGKPTESGNFEEWYTNPTTWHRAYTEKKLTGQEWSTARTKQLKTKDSKLDIARLDHAVAQPLVDPVAAAANYKPALDMSLQAGTFEGVVLDCVVATNPAQAAGGINPDVLFPRLCFDVKDSTLRFTTTADTLTAYTNFKPLGTRSIANKVEVKPYNRLGAALDITLLEPLAASDQAQVTPPANAQPLPYAHQSNDTPLVPLKITECAYPMDARDNHELGVVTVPILIKKDGSVKSNGQAMGQPHLASAAGDCVGNYKFQPFLIDGEPVEVSDFLLYNYDGKPFSPSKVTIASQPPPPAAAAAK
jgi:Gram-negative bacterial TonB protein C-terminal